MWQELLMVTGDGNVGRPGEDTGVDNEGRSAVMLGSGIGDKTAAGADIGIRCHSSGGDYITRNIFVGNFTAYCTHSDQLSLYFMAQRLGSLHRNFSANWQQKSTLSPWCH